MFSGDPHVKDIPSVKVAQRMGEKVDVDHAEAYFDGSHVLSDCR